MEGSKEYSYFDKSSQANHRRNSSIVYPCLWCQKSHACAYTCVCMRECVCQGNSNNIWLGIKLEPIVLTEKANVQHVSLINEIQVR